jgi:hypothetical protein
MTEKGSESKYSDLVNAQVSHRDPQRFTSTCCLSPLIHRSFAHLFTDFLAHRRDSKAGKYWMFGL